MPTLDDLNFELERRIILFHRDTSLPDDSQLGYVGDPNAAINNNSPGETLLYNCPAGARYLDKALDPQQRWVKVQDIPGGIWEKESALETGELSSTGYFETFNSHNQRLRTGRYLSYKDKPSNIVGLPIMYNVNLVGILVKTHEPCSGWIRICANEVIVYSVQLSSQNFKIVTGIKKVLTAGAAVSMYVQSAAGIIYPTVRLHLS